jgi:hypothetical protein
MNTIQHCPAGIATDELSAWRDHELGDVESRRIEAHISSCDVCRQTLSAFDDIPQLLQRQRLPAPDSRLWRDVSAAMSQTGRRGVWVPASVVGRGITVAVAAVLLIGLFTSMLARQGMHSTPGISPTASNSPTWTPLATLEISPTPAVATTPSPISSLLGPAPTDCPTIYPPHKMTLTQPIHVIDESGVYYPGSTVHGSSPIWLFSDGGKDLNYGGYTPWPYLKIQILIEPQYTNYVSLQVVNTRTGQPLLFNVDSGYPPDNPHGIWTPEDVFDFRGTDITQWKDLKAFPFVPQAGCYRMTVTWQGGQWSETHAVGR